MAFPIHSIHSGMWESSVWFTSVHWNCHLHCLQHRLYVLLPYTRSFMCPTDKSVWDRGLEIWVAAGTCTSCPPASQVTVLVIRFLCATELARDNTQLSCT